MAKDTIVECPGTGKYSDEYSIEVGQGWWLTCTRCRQYFKVGFGHHEVPKHKVELDKLGRK